uniref:Carboxymuconolactone decarboxylase n=1 Tax=Cyanothece sp. (strain PCC 7425 / ATCC 29141) TaxID=395961 RepID=B8HU93_CYAP4
MAPEIPLPQDRDLPAEVVERLSSLPPINIYRMLGHAPQAVIPWTDLIKALYGSKLNSRYREIAILRQAHRAQAPYELHQHTLIAKANGITEEEICSILTEEKVQSLSPLENLICQAADELECQATLSEETFTRLNEAFDHRELIELLLLISVYCAVARFLNGARIQIEDSDPLAGQSSPN